MPSEQFTDTGCETVDANVFSEEERKTLQKILRKAGFSGLELELKLLYLEKDAAVTKQDFAKALSLREKIDKLTPKKRESIEENPLVRMKQDMDKVKATFSIMKESMQTLEEIIERIECTQFTQQA